MKKVLAILLALAMLLSLYACGSSDTKPTDPTSNSQSTTGSEENTASGEETTTDTTEDATEDVTKAPTQAPTQAPTPNTPATCSHNWKAATCTAAKTCSKCGATEGKATGHSWNAATCTAPKTCKTCKATEGNAAGHNWTAATCTAPKTCKTCKATEGNAANHSWTAATCTAPKTCSTCGATEGAVGAHTFADGACTVCGAADSIKPEGKIITDAEYIGNFRLPEMGMNASALGFTEEDCRILTWFLSENPEGKYSIGGKRYKSDGMGGAAIPFWYEVTDSEIIITNQVHEENSGVACLKLIMLSNGNLKVTFSTLEDFPVGTILYAGREAATASVPG